MALFRRNKTTSTKTTKVPAEVQDYYEAGRRERTGIAWLLGLATLIVTILLALLLFFGGRWIYRKVTNNGDKDNKSGSSQSESQKPQDQDQNQDKDDTPAAGTPDTSDNDQSTSPTGDSSNSSNTMPATGDSTALPRTGPDLDL